MEWIIYDWILSINITKRKIGPVQGRAMILPLTSLLTDPFLLFVFSATTTATAAFILQPAV